MYRLSAHSVFASSLINIGNYSQKLNPIDCGVSRLSSKVDTKCFEWHKGFPPALQRGKIVGFGDAPWMAMLKYTLLKDDQYDFV